MAATKKAEGHEPLFHIVKRPAIAWWHAWLIRIGIPVSEQNRVFDKFYRGSNLPDRSLPGIGLGLSYVKLLVEAHHGSISLNSQAGKGTTIEIIIPQ